MPILILNEWQDQIRQAAAQGTPLLIRGGQSKPWFYEGTPAGAVVLEATAYRGIVAYQPSELVITARCGTPLSDIEHALAEQGQMLAFEPPHFGPHATLGGCVAAGLSGPRRASVGSCRDFVLGAQMINGRGELLRFGGQVMKNVAGYDVSRTLAGSLGRLGMVTEISLKVWPRPKLEVTLLFDVEAHEALRRLHEWAGQPLPLSGSVWCAERLYVRLSGAASAVTSARDKLLSQWGGTVLEPDIAQTFWYEVREHRHAFFSTPGSLWRLSVPSTTPYLAFPEPTFMAWGGALRWTTCPSSPEAETIGDSLGDSLRWWAQTAGGHAAPFYQRPDDASLSAPLRALQQRLQQAFDPAGVFGARFSNSFNRRDP